MSQLDLIHAPDGLSLARLTSETRESIRSLLKGVWVKLPRTRKDETWFVVWGRALGELDYVIPGATRIFDYLDPMRDTFVSMVKVNHIEQMSLWSGIMEDVKDETKQVNLLPTMGDQLEGKLTEPHYAKATNDLRASVGLEPLEPAEVYGETALPDDGVHMVVSAPSPLEQAQAEITRLKAALEAQQKANDQLNADLKLVRERRDKWREMYDASERSYKIILSDNERLSKEVKAFEWVEYTAACNYDEAVRLEKELDALKKSYRLVMTNGDAPRIGVYRVIVPDVTIGTERGQIVFRVMSEDELKRLNVEDAAALPASSTSMVAASPFIEWREDDKIDRVVVNYAVNLRDNLKRMKGGQREH